MYTDYPKIEMFGHILQHHVLWKPHTAYQNNHIKSPAKPSGGVMIYACFVAIEAKQRTISELTLNSTVQYTKVI